MSNYKRILAGIDFTEMDKAVIRYLSFLCGIIHPEKIYFVNIQRNLDVPEGIREKFPELSRPQDEKLKEEMTQLVQANFSGYENFEIEYDVIEGSPLPEMLRWAHIKNVDLTVVGRKAESKGSGVLAQQMARKGMCSVLFVPESAHAKLENIFVAVDFSENAKQALEQGWKLASINSNVKLLCYHTYNLPLGYYKTGKTDEEFAEIMRANSEEKLHEFIIELKIPKERVISIFELEAKLSVGEMITKSAAQHKADMLLVGAKGRTDLTAIFLGSVAEKLIKLNDNIPLLVVKRKDKSFNFLDFIKNV